MPWEGHVQAAARLYYFFLFSIFTGFPAGTVQIREHQQLQQEICNLSVLVGSQMDITSYHFRRFEVKHLENPAKVKPEAASSLTFPVGECSVDCCIAGFFSFFFLEFFQVLRLIGGKSI